MLKPELKQVVIGILMGIGMSTVYFNLTTRRLKGYDMIDFITGLGIGVACGGILVLLTGCADLSMAQMEQLDRCELNSELCQRDIVKGLTNQDQCSKENFACHDKIKSLN